MREGRRLGLAEFGSPRDRPGIGSSTPHVYDDGLDWTGDVTLVADVLGIDTGRLVKPLAGPILGLYATLQPPGDRELLARPELRAMFVDDLLNGSRKQVTAPLPDLILSCRPSGFELADVQVPVRWRHGEHMVLRLPDATLRTIEGRATSPGWAWPRRSSTR